MPIWYHLYRSEFHARNVGCKEERSRSYARGASFTLEMKWKRDVKKTKFQKVKSLPPVNTEKKGGKSILEQGQFFVPPCKEGGGSLSCKKRAPNCITAHVKTDLGGLLRVEDLLHELLSLALALGRRGPSPLLLAHILTERITKIPLYYHMIDVQNVILCKHDSASDRCPRWAP